jgi:hypothetical protein
VFTFLNQNSGSFLVLFSFIVAIATATYARLTWKLVSETRKMREVQTEPNIFVSIQSKEDWIGFIDLVIENIGLGAAYNLKFEIEPDFEYSKGHFLSTLNFMKNGVNRLAPNRKITHFLASLIGNQELGKAKFEFTVKYENCVGKSYQKSYILDFSEFWGIRRVGEPALRNIAKNLEKIKEDIHRVSSGMDKVKVIAYTVNDIEKETERQLKQIEQFEKEQEAKEKKI